MTNLAISSFGIKLEMGDGGSSEVFTEIAEVRDITGPGLELTMTETTAHDGDGFRNFVPTLKDAGEVSFPINYVPTNGTHDASTGLLKDYSDRTRRNYKLIFPDTSTTTWTFSGYVTGFEPAGPVEGALCANVTIKVAGAPTLA